MKPRMRCGCCRSSGIRLQFLSTSILGSMGHGSFGGTSVDFCGVQPDIESDTEAEAPGGGAPTSTEKASRAELEGAGSGAVVAVGLSRADGASGSEGASGNADSCAPADNGTMSSSASALG